MIALVALTTLLVSPAWIAEQQAAKAPLIVLHVGSRADYDAGHIPGAQLITLKDVSDPEAALNLQMASIDRLRTALQDRGIGDDTPVVIYFGGDSSVTAAARVFVALDYVGLGDRTSLLDGGLAAWRSDNRPIATVASPPARATLTPRPRADVIVDAAWVAAHLHDPHVTVVDARTPPFYAGSMAGNYPRQGHIAGAVSVPYNSLTDASSLRFKSEDALRAILDAAGVKPGTDVVTYCHIGQQASAAYFAARLLGYRPYLYDGSFEEWSAHPDLPIEAGVRKQ